jgi:hypothetical protein
MPRKIHRTVSALLTFVACTATNQAFAAKSKPSSVDVGVVRVGSIVETSFRISWENSEPQGTEPTTETPSFARQTGFVAIESRGRQLTQVNLIIDTSSVGEFEGVVRVTYGSQSIDVPLSAEIREPEPGLRNVLIADTPFDASSYIDDAEMDPWRELVASSPVAANYLVVPFKGPVLRTLDLSNFDVILLCENGVHGLSDEDIDRLREFAGNGGRVILTAIGFHVGTVEIVNKVALPYGIKMFVTSSTTTGRDDRIAIGPELIVDDLLMKDVRRLCIEQFTPILVTDPIQSSILVRVPDASGGGFLTRSRIGSGELIVLTNYLWWKWINDAGTDNAKLLKNLLLTPVSPNQS